MRNISVISLSQRRRLIQSARILNRRALSTAAYVTEEVEVSPRRKAEGIEGRRPPIYVAATRQHVGKTTTSLAVMSGLMKRFEKVGFMKPVGQKCLMVRDEFGKEVEVDKDVAVVRQHFHLNHCAYHNMSPVRILPGYTKNYIDGKLSNEEQLQTILDAYRAIDDCSDVVLCEGTGHCAVGSIVGASNARVAQWLGAKMILVANGGLGSTYDELELNKVLCDTHGVEIAGVIVNRVSNEKYDQTKYYLEKVLRQNWDVPLLACIPDRPFLGCPALADLEKLMKGSYLVATNQEQRMKHYRVQDINLVATSLACFLRNLRENQDRTLYLCHSSRVDIMLGFLMEYQRMKERGEIWEAALVVCGTEEYQLPQHVMDIYTGMDAPPMLVCKEGTRATMEQILHYTPKHNNQDTHRLEIAVNHYEPYIDFDLLLERTGNSENQKIVTA